MLLVELATQGVKGFSAQSKAVFKAGYNVVSPPPGVPASLVTLLSALFFNDGRGGDAALVSGTAPARTGLTMIGKDGRTYRLVRQLGGAGALHQLQPNNAWTVISQDSQDINQALRTALGLPTRAQFEEIFCISPTSLPSRRPPPEAKKAEAPTPSLAAAPAATPQGGAHGGGGHGGPNAAGPQRSLRPNALVEQAMAASKQKFDINKAQKDLVRLREDLTKAKEIEEHQFALEGMQQQIDACETKLKRLDKLVENVETTKTACSSGHTIQSLGLPADALARTARFDEAQGKLDEQIKKLREDELEGRERASQVQVVAPLYKLLNFQIGMGAGLASFALGMALRGGGGRYLALLDIPAFGFAALTALQWIGEAQGQRTSSLKVNISKDREQKLMLSFDGEYFPIKTALKITGLETGAELIALLKQREALEAEQIRSEEALNAAKSDPEFLQALDDQDRLAVTAKELEAKITELGANAGRDWREIEREIEEIEDAVAAEGGSAAVASSGVSVTAGEPPGKEDPTPHLLALSQDLFNMALETIAGTVTERAGQYFMALSDRRYSGVLLDAKGQATAISPSRNVPAGQLDDRDLDLLYLAVKLTLIEKLAPTSKLAVVLDEPFAGFEDAKLQLISRMLKHIGTLTQVLHATTAESHKTLADTIVSL